MLIRINIYGPQQNRNAEKAEKQMFANSLVVANILRALPSTKSEK